MKKIISILLFTFITASVFAQTTSFGIKGGLNFSTQSDDKNAVGKLPGFNIGGICNLQFDAFAIQPGMFFSVKGVREKVNIIDPATFAISRVNQEIKINYLEIPVNILHKFPTKSSVRFYVGGGPYAACAISGTIMTGQTKTDLSFEDYYRIDFGFNATGGVELQKKIVASLNYALGIAAVSQIQTRNNTSNRTLSVSVGYLFQ